ncbi:hypothetical protein HaLaN_31115 [Haematococcus lacustris]|uniref:Uncharacterized protein n=1 Tax=Haematococcus lacustris TaxID=44745 RepID=A0A6A0AH94_HAELA|nr:hypothetical protein HaLaN_31115 [Haematococcus lacustris]
MARKHTHLAHASCPEGGKADTAEVPAPMHAGQQTVPSKVPPPELTPGAERHKARQKLDTTSGLNLSLHFNNAATEQPEPGRHPQQPHTGAQLLQHDHT